MKPRWFLILSLLLNLTLSALWILPRREASTPKAATATGDLSMPVTIVVTNAPPASAVTSNAPMDWTVIESEDYHRYVANLRAVGCPEHTVRDIIVADIDNLYLSKKRASPLATPIWQNRDRRRIDSVARKAKESVLETEKRALVREVLGYEWENRADELWEGDFGLAKFLGFLPDAKSLQLIAMVERYTDQAKNIKETANNILIAEDRVQLRRLYDGLANEVSQLLTPAEREELELRTQAMNFLSEGDGIRWEGVAVNAALLKEFVRLSKRYWNIWEDNFLGIRPPSATEQTRRRAEFESQVQKLFGPVHYAEYRRAQDPEFRETSAFIEEQGLPFSSAISIYAIRHAAEEQAGKLKADESISAEERTAALTALKSSSVGKISGALGQTSQEYLDYRGQWLEKLAASLEPRSQNQEP
jgi:hypothetical protein